MGRRARRPPRRVGQACCGQRRRPSRICAEMRGVKACVDGGDAPRTACVGRRACGPEPPFQSLREIAFRAGCPRRAPEHPKTSCVFFFVFGLVVHESASGSLEQASANTALPVASSRAISSPPSIIHTRLHIHTSHSPVHIWQVGDELQRDRRRLPEKGTRRTRDRSEVRAFRASKCSPIGVRCPTSAKATSLSCCSTGARTSPSLARRGGLAIPGPARDDGTEPGRDITKRNRAR